MSKKTLPAEGAPTTPQEIAALAARAQDGDKKALPALRELLKDPAWVDALGGDLAYQAQRSLIARFGSKNLLVQESLPRKLNLLRAELGGPSPTPLERLLVERILTCWLHLHDLEIVYARQDSMSLDVGTYYQQSIDRAQKRYLSAIKALAVVRRLALPVLVAQVNVAHKQQVNVGGPRAAARQPEERPRTEPAPAQPAEAIPSDAGNASRKAGPAPAREGPPPVEGEDR